MKIKLFTIALAFIGINSLAQITVTDADILDVGDIVYEALDSVSGSAIQIGPAGANQTWDFSNLQQNEVNIIEHVEPNTTPFGSIHPTSNICTNEDGEYQYFKKSLTSVAIVGFDDQKALNPVTILPLPLTYPMQLSTGPVLVIDESESNYFIEDSIAPLMTSGAAHTVDSISFQVVIESDFDVDGYGDVIIPMGTFPALRVSVVITHTENAYLYCTDTLFGTNSGWYPAPQQLFPGNTETEYVYQWWSNDPAVKFALVNIDVDEYGYNDGEIQFLTNNTTSVEEKNDLQFSVFPVPATYILTIEAKFNESADLNLVDINGKVVLNKQFSQTTSLDLAVIAKGIYYLNLSTTQGKLTKKIIIQ